MQKWAASYVTEFKKGLYQIDCKDILFSWNT